MKFSGYTQTATKGMIVEIRSAYDSCGEEIDEYGGTEASIIEIAGEDVLVAVRNGPSVWFRWSRIKLPYYRD